MRCGVPKSVQLGFSRPWQFDVTAMYGPPQDCKEKLWARRQVCGNVFGLWWEIISPGHDEFRCVAVLTSRWVVEDHYRYQVEGTPL
jgi:hypothetical protein